MFHLKKLHPLLVFGMSLIYCILFSIITYNLGGAQTPFTHLFYIAIIFAAIHGGWITTLFTVFLSFTLTSHFIMPLSVIENVPQSIFMSLFRGFMFAFVGIGVKSMRCFIVKKYIQASKDQERMLIQMLKIAELRDPEVTGLHLERTVAYAQILLKDINIAQKEKDLIMACIPFHDIGKIGISDKILLKPDKLTSEEYNEMKRHTIIGKQILENIETSIENTHIKEIVSVAKEICYFHHERVDGCGYPLGIKGDEIPFSARVTALCDVYDALATARPYKEPFPHEECVRIIKDGRNKQFDGELVDCFLRVENEFREISEKLGLLESSEINKFSLLNMANYTYIVHSEDTKSPQFTQFILNRAKKLQQLMGFFEEGR